MCMHVDGYNLVSIQDDGPENVRPLSIAKNKLKGARERNRTNYIHFENCIKVNELNGIAENWINHDKGKKTRGRHYRWLNTTHKDGNAICV